MRSRISVAPRPPRYTRQITVIFYTISRRGQRTVAPGNERSGAGRRSWRHGKTDCVRTEFANGLAAERNVLVKGAARAQLKAQQESVTNTRDPLMR